MSVFCKTCGELMMWPDNHRCPEAWETRHEDDCEDDERTIVHARSGYFAAEKAAKKWDEDGGEYTLASNEDSAIFYVRPRWSDEKWQKFRVSGGFEAVYYPTEIEEEET